MRGITELCVGRRYDGTEQSTEALIVIAFRQQPLHALYETRYPGIPGLVFDFLLEFSGQSISTAGRFQSLGGSTKSRCLSAMEANKQKGANYSLGKG